MPADRNLLVGILAVQMNFVTKDQLVAVNAGTQRSEFAYDGLQRRARQIEKEVGVVIASYALVVSRAEVLERRAGTGEVLRPFTFGNHVNGASEFTVRDHLQSVWAVSSAAGVVARRTEYSPYGAASPASAGAPDLDFTGLFKHNQTGLVLARYRVYDPVVGRWLSEDPAQLSDGPNRYAYVRGRPTMWIDPEGTFGIYPYWPNGNFTPDFTKQDMTCSLGPLASTADRRSCVLECCQVHDDCYSRNLCNFTSWLTITYNSPCTVCNRDVALCWFRAIPLPPDACEDKCKK